MKIKLELLIRVIIDFVRCNIEEMEIDADKIVDTAATKALEEVRDVIQDKTLDDFMKVDKIVDVLNWYYIDTGECHDFWCMTE